MVAAAKNRSLLRGESGTAMVEGLIVFPLVLLAIAAFFEFGYAVYQYNQTVKALQYGARRAAVSDYLIALPNNDADGIPDALISDYVNDAGTPVPSTVVSVSCGVGTTACDTDELNRLVYGSDDTCTTNLGTSMPGMCDYNDRIRPENVLITYYRAGLGFIGRPSGPVVTVSVEVPNLTFDLPFIGALLGFNEFTIPAHAVTLTSEDLSNTK